MRYTLNCLIAKILCCKISFFGYIIESMKELILKKLRKDVKKHSLSGMADKIKIHYTNLYRIVKGVGTCTMKTWEKLETYYNQ